MRYLLLLSTTLLALLTIVSTGAVAGEWKRIPPSEAKIVFDAPGLIHDGRFWKNSRTSVSAQHGSWFSGPLAPRAEVYLEDLWPDYVRGSRIRLEQSIKGWKFLQGKNLDLGATSKAVNVLGRVEYRQFKVEEFHCVGFGQHFGEGGMWDNDRDILPDYISGYYCDAEPLTDDVVKAVIQALGVRGYKTPRTKKAGEKDASQRWVLCKMDGSNQIKMTYAKCQETGGSYRGDVK